MIAVPGQPLQRKVAMRKGFGQLAEPNPVGGRPGVDPVILGQVLDRFLNSADSDYARAVECVKFFGKTVELAVTKNQKAAKMKQLADVVIEMDQDFVLGCE